MKSLRVLSAFALLLTLPACSLFGDVLEGNDDDTDDLEVQGIVTQVGADFLIVGDASYRVTEDTEFDGYDGLADVEIGDEVEIEYMLTDDGRVALEVEPFDGEGEDGDELEVQGIVAQVGDNFLIVGDASYRVTEATEFEGYNGLADVNEGDEVEIEYALGDDGRIALEVERQD